MMYGKPKDIEGECNAHLYIGDDFGDNVATARCQLKEDHVGPHREVFRLDEQPVIITWFEDDKEDDD